MYMHLVDQSYKLLVHDVCIHHYTHTLCTLTTSHTHTHTHTHCQLQGSIYYKEKKLNVSKAVRKHGGQYIRPNQEFMNSVPSTGYYVTQDGLWTPYTVPSHAQPVKVSTFGECFDFLLMGSET